MKNEERYIGRCIESLFSQDYPEIELVVFDGGSVDRSKQIASDLFEGREKCSLFDNPKGIQSAAWNMGIEMAKGDIIGIVSAHAVLAPDYASSIVETLNRTGADLVGGPTFADSEGYVAKAIAVAMNSPFGVGNAKFHYTNKEIEVDTVFMGACRRRVYEEIGGFDEEMVRNQDDELSYRLTGNGGRIICNPAIKSRYFNRASLWKLWTQYYQYGLWKVRVLQKHPTQMRWRHFVPPNFVGVLIGLAIITFFSPLGEALLAIAVGAYLIANLTASSITSAKKGWPYFPLLPLSFAILHLSYGLGFLAGLFRFRNRWGDKKGKVPKFQPRHT